MSPQDRSGPDGGRALLDRRLCSCTRRAPGPPAPTPRIGARPVAGVGRRGALPHRPRSSGLYGWRSRLRRGPCGPLLALALFGALPLGGFAFGLAPARLVRPCGPRHAFRNVRGGPRNTGRGDWRAGLLGGVSREQVRQDRSLRDASVLPVRLVSGVRTGARAPRMPGRRDVPRCGVGVIGAGRCPPAHAPSGCPTQWIAIVGLTTCSPKPLPHAGAPSSGTDKIAAAAPRSPVSMAISKSPPVAVRSPHPGGSLRASARAHLLSAWPPSCGRSRHW